MDKIKKYILILNDEKQVLLKKDIGEEESKKIRLGFVDLMHVINPLREGSVKNFNRVIYFEENEDLAKEKLVKTYLSIANRKPNSRQNLKYINDFNTSFVKNLMKKEDEKKESFIEKITKKKGKKKNA